MGRLNHCPPDGQPRLADFFGFGQARVTGAAISLFSAEVNGALNVTLRSECLSRETHDDLIRQIESRLIQGLDA